MGGVAWSEEEDNCSRDAWSDMVKASGIAYLFWPVPEELQIEMVELPTPKHQRGVLQKMKSISSLSSTISSTEHQTSINTEKFIRNPDHDQPKTEEKTRSGEDCHTGAEEAGRYAMDYQFGSSMRWQQQQQWDWDDSIFDIDLWT
ncbi:hypothetical protein F3Y22_tig00111403pilonHSYRG00101 [Hibiscus syriacus]|uniref:Uncharacterized protein n=1 Tax=Hibiscus syriacus TaxID=106335 RepID=A0A6A2YG22_HIBSY|nr:hypothetical protein F3Y22_tig00111403pilonHSYRG00101 [Hibiscus syriacus]